MSPRTADAQIDDLLGVAQQALRRSDEAGANEAETRELRVALYAVIGAIEVLRHRAAINGAAISEILDVEGHS